MNCWIILLLLLCCNGNLNCGNSGCCDQNDFCGGSQNGNCGNNCNSFGRDDCGCGHTRPGRGGNFGGNPEAPCGGMPPVRADFAYNYEEKCDCNE